MTLSVRNRRPQGDDVYLVHNAEVIVIETSSGGTDEIRTGLSSISIAGIANVERLAFTGTGGFTGVGNSGNNIITGAAGNDTLDGGDGNDVLTGGLGYDVYSVEMGMTCSASREADQVMAVKEAIPSMS